MKTRPKKESAKQRARRLTPPTFTEMLREEFLRPLGLTFEDLYIAILSAESPLKVCSKQGMRWRFSQGNGSTPVNRYLSPDLALLLDWLFGAPEGYFMRLWAICAARTAAHTARSWLTKVKPISRSARRKMVAATAGSIPARDDTLPPKTAGDILADLEARCARQDGRLKTVRQLVDWAERKLAQAETGEILAKPAAAKAIREHKAGKTVFGRIRDLRARVAPLPRGETPRDLIRARDK